MNKFILGTANFLNEYHGIRLNESQCIELLEEFKSLGGEMVNTANNYCNESTIEELINKYDLIDLHKINETGALYINSDKVGHSIYYPFQIDCHDKITEIPNSNIFDDFLSVLRLHSKIYVRSNFTIDKKHHIKNIEYIDGYILGVDNIEQLRENMKVLK